MSKISKLDKSTSRQLYLGMNEFTHGEAYFASGTFFMHKFKLGLGALLAKSTEKNRSLKTDNHLSTLTFHSKIVSQQLRDEPLETFNKFWPIIYDHQKQIRRFSGISV